MTTHQTQEHPMAPGHNTPSRTPSRALLACLAALAAAGWRMQTSVHPHRSARELHLIDGQDHAHAIVRVPASGRPTRIDAWPDGEDGPRQQLAGADEVLRVLRELADASARPAPEVGTVVRYAGSLVQHHGVYRVLGVVPAGHPLAGRVQLEDPNHPGRALLTVSAGNHSIAPVPAEAAAS